MGLSKYVSACSSITVLDGVLFRNGKKLYDCLDNTNGRQKIPIPDPVISAAANYDLCFIDLDLAALLASIIPKPLLLHREHSKG